MLLHAMLMHPVLYVLLMMHHSMIWRHLEMHLLVLRMLLRLLLEVLGASGHMLHFVLLCARFDIRLVAFRISSCLASVVLCTLPAASTVAVCAIGRRNGHDLTCFLHLGAKLRHFPLHALAKLIVMDVWEPVAFGKVDELVELAIHLLNRLLVAVRRGIAAVFVHEIGQHALGTEWPYVLALDPLGCEMIPTSVGVVSILRIEQTHRIKLGKTYLLLRSSSLSMRSCRSAVLCLDSSIFFFDLESRFAGAGAVAAAVGLYSVLEAD